MLFQQPLTIGFIGLGNMGGPMAKNLLKNGHKLIVSDVVRAHVQDLQSKGADVADNPADIASKTSIVITMLPSRQVRIEYILHIVHVVELIIVYLNLEIIQQHCNYCDLR